MLFESEEQKRLRRDAYAGLVQMLKEVWREDRPAFWRGVLPTSIFLVGSVAFFIGTWQSQLFAGGCAGAWIGLVTSAYIRKRD